MYWRRKKAQVLRKTHVLSLFYKQFLNVASIFKSPRIIENGKYLFHALPDHRVRNARKLCLQLLEEFHALDIVVGAELRHVEGEGGPVLARPHREPAITEIDQYHIKLLELQFRCMCLNSPEIVLKYFLFYRQFGKISHTSFPISSDKQDHA